jgi:hypothetical protein
MRRRVRFEDEATEVDVEGDDFPALYTSAAGTEQLISAVRAGGDALAMSRSGKDGSADVKAKREVRFAIAQVFSKCRVDLGYGVDRSADEVMIALRRIEQCFVNYSGYPTARGFW